MKEVITTDHAPAAIGPYSQGIRVGNLIFISGQLPIDPQTKEFAGPDIKTQTEQSIKNLTAVLAEGGASIDDVVKATVFLKNMDDFADMNDVYARYFTGDCPARAAVEVARLPKDALVEIEAIAYKEG